MPPGAWVEVGEEVTIPGQGPHTCCHRRKSPVAVMVRANEKMETVLLGAAVRVEAEGTALLIARKQGVVERTVPLTDVWICSSAVV